MEFRHRSNGQLDAVRKRDMLELNVCLSGPRVVSCDRTYRHRKLALSLAGAMIVFSSGPPRDARESRARCLWFADQDEEEVWRQQFVCRCHDKEHDVSCG